MSVLPAHCTQPLRPSRAAFSLLELVLVVAIVAIMAAMAIPRVGSSIAIQNANGAARRISADFELARRRAVTTSLPQTVRIVDTGDKGYALIGMNHPDHPSQPYVVSLSRDCFGVGLVSYDLGGDLDLTFDMYGIPDSAGQVVIAAGTVQRVISIDADTGRVSISG